MKTIVFQSLHQVIGLPEEEQKLFKNYSLKLFELGFENVFDLHVKEVTKRGKQILIGDREYILSELDSHKSEIIDELKT